MSIECLLELRAAITQHVHKLQLVLVAQNEE